MVTVFVPKTADGEHRVAATPDSVKRMVARGLKLVIETGAGLSAHYDDEQYLAAGAVMQPDAETGLAEADVTLLIQPPTAGQIGKMKSGSSMIGFLWAFENLDTVKQLNERKISAFAIEALPRITRAQKSDALSSQANLAGYKAVIAAAYHLDKICPLLMTAAGTIKPARFVVIGVGVAGLQAIATARRLGAIVEATDPRPETKEQTESLGAKFLEVEGVEVKKGEGGYAAEQTEEYKQAQAKMLADAFANADAIITTALIPYKPAPKIITAEHVKSMKHGSVIVDLAAERGGNCELTKPGETVVEHGVTILGETNWPGTLSINASDVYARNLQNVLLDAVDKQGALVWDFEDEVVAGAMICHGGEVRHPKVRELMGLEPLDESKPAASAAENHEEAGKAEKKETP